MAFSQRSIWYSGSDRLRVRKASEGLKPSAGVCLFKTFGNYIVVSDVRLHNSYFRDNVQCESGRVGKGMGFPHVSVKAA